MSRIDISGKRFGRLVAIDFIGKYRGASLWLCRCDCGKEKQIASYSLRAGYTRSCGCLQSEETVSRKTTHGASRCREYYIWKHMISRCYDPERTEYHRYGGRGIKVCKRWRDSVWNFIKDMGHQPDKRLTLDRINNDGNYTPKNCRWATRKTQSNNTSQTRWVKIMGVTMTAMEASEMSGLHRETIKSRIKKGWRDDMIFAPLHTRGTPK